jgi:hypothetical protein
VIEIGAALGSQNAPAGFSTGLRASGARCSDTPTIDRLNASGTGGNEIATAPFAIFPQKNLEASRPANHPAETHWDGVPIRNLEWTRLRLQQGQQVQAGLRSIDEPHPGGWRCLHR